jgi:thiamine-phosphate pyrophosphorylase
MRRYYITDRGALGGVGPLVDNIARAAAAGVEMIQVRERDLADGPLLALVRRAVEIAAPLGVKVLVNGRPDLALAGRAQGVHLPAGSIAPARWRELVAADFLVGVSCHSVEDVREAAREGAGFAVLGPVFPTASKAAYGPPLGLAVLREAARAVAIPVFALGGVTERNAPDCIEAGAAGVAGISLFQPCQNEK